ncbi:MAG: bifunctional 2-C-methyl-D-erythritol 4-phosphate cytidylyltransferase/2-C-methyl-D-erythritol 2,4-cyclodiphosphate synthase [Thalassobaculales bacterium]
MDATAPPARRAAALVVAAGRGTRLGGERPKQYLPLAGRPILRLTLDRLLAHPAIAAVQVVIHPDDRALYDDATAGLDLPPPVAGGAERQDSVRAGLEALDALAPEHVLIHDAARPFADAGLIGRVLAALASAPGAIPAIPIADTVKRAAQGLVAATVDRQGLFRVQTPQGFHFPTIRDLHRRHAGQSFTDDAGLLEAAGLPVALVAGDEANVKITTRADLAAAEAALETRVGSGFDVHRFGPGERVMLGGVAIPHERGLVGHSDADVGLHALTDAILGALAAGDIGAHFPPSEARWKGADSARFLAHAANLARARGGVILHVDLTLICERPKIGPHREAMRARIAGILGIAADRVSVKATTTEGLGFTGRGEGIAAQATATLRLPP